MSVAPQAPYRTTPATVFLPARLAEMGHQEMRFAASVLRLAMALGAHTKLSKRGLARLAMVMEASAYSRAELSRDRAARNGVAAGVFTVLAASVGALFPPWGLLPALALAVLAGLFLMRQRAELRMAEAAADMLEASKALSALLVLAPEDGKQPPALVAVAGELVALVLPELNEIARDRRDAAVAATAPTADLSPEAPGRTTDEGPL